MSRTTTAQLREAARVLGHEDAILVTLNTTSARRGQRVSAFVHHDGDDYPVRHVTSLVDQVNEGDEGDGLGLVVDDLGLVIDGASAGEPSTPAPDATPATPRGAKKGQG